MVVEEQPTGSLTLGGAFSSSEGLSAQISLTERNFLGRGQTVSGSVSGSSQFANVEFGFSEPALFDRDLLPGSTSTTATGTSTSSRSRPRTSASSRGSAFP